MTVDVFTFAWNEAAFLPYFLRHYQTFARSITLHDNGSTDGTDRLAREAGCRVVTNDTGGRIDNERLAYLKNTCWKGSDADWVVVCDCDELLYARDVVGELAKYRAAGEAVPTPVGYEMLADQFPTTAGQVYDEVRHGFPDPLYAKAVVFDPRIAEIGYGLGAHGCDPVGAVPLRASTLKLLHFRYLGIDHLAAKWARYRPRVKPTIDPAVYQTYTKDRAWLEAAWPDFHEMKVQVVL